MFFNVFHWENFRGGVLKKKKPIDLYVDVIFERIVWLKNIL